jgi:hypothetical protein
MCGKIRRGYSLGREDSVDASYTSRRGEFERRIAPLAAEAMA